MSEYSTSPRLAARVILIDAQDRILFCRGEEPVTGMSFWVMPGGGLEAGETFEDAARREVQEEVGLAIIIGPCVWHRRHRLVWNGEAVDQFEKFFVARGPYPSQISGGNPDSYIKEYRWWTLDEIAASNEEFAPRRVAALLVQVLAGEVSGEPVDCGV